MSIKQGTLTPLVFSVFGTSALEYKVFLKSLFQKIADKRKEKYGDVASWARCRMSFLCLKATLMCLRGTRFDMSDDFKTYNIENGEPTKRNLIVSFLIVNVFCNFICNSVIVI